MTDGRSKSNMDLWKEACEEFAKKEEQWANLKKKDGVRGQQIQEAIEQFKIYLPILEAAKDIDQPLSVGCKTHLAGVYATEKYHKWSPVKDIGNRATAKGTECEPQGIELVNEVDGLLLIRNEERIENDWFSGHPDCVEIGNNEFGVVIHDIKCPYDIESFFSYINKEIPPLYYWQMQGYMDLSGAKLAKVHFCLVNNPEYQIKSSCEALLRRMDVISEYSPEYIKAQAEMVNNMTFDDIPKKDRRFTFIVERNDEDILRARKKVEKCREYLQDFEKIHLNLKENT
jgi:hypothetical protein